MGQKTIPYGPKTQPILEICLAIAQHLSTVQRADQILVIEEGRIVERGRHEERMKLEGRYHRLYTLQARI